MTVCAPVSGKFLRTSRDQCPLPCVAEVDDRIQQQLDQNDCVGACCPNSKWPPESRSQDERPHLKKGREAIGREVEHRELATSTAVPARCRRRVRLGEGHVSAGPSYRTVPAHAIDLIDFRSWSQTPDITDIHEKDPCSRPVTNEAKEFRSTSSSLSSSSRGQRSPNAGFG